MHKPASLKSLTPTSKVPTTPLHEKYANDFISPSCDGNPLTCSLTVVFWNSVVYLFQYVETYNKGIEQPTPLHQRALLL